jgi:hypothetical protein
MRFALAPSRFYDAGRLRTLLEITHFVVFFELLFHDALRRVLTTSTFASPELSILKFTAVRLRDRSRRETQRVHFFQSQHRKQLS